MNFREYLNILKSFVQNGVCPTVNLTMYREVLKKEVLNPSESSSRERLDFTKNLEQIEEGHVNAISLIVEEDKKDTTIYIPLSGDYPLSYSLLRDYKIVAIDTSYEFTCHKITLAKPIIFRVRSSEIEIFNMAGSGGLICTLQDGIVARSPYVTGINVEFLDTDGDFCSVV